jgi:RHS repeat-associated protein
VQAQTHFSQVGTLSYSGTSTYSYDDAGQLTNDGATAYSYDLNGNRTMAGYQTGAANRLTNDGVFTYTYDDEGNLTQKSKGSGLETWYYGYDNANRMTNVRKTSNGSTDLLLLTYTYDVQGNRVKEQEWVSGGSATETRFAYDDKDVWADLSSGNTVETRRMFGDKDDQVLTRTVASGPNAGLSYYQTDGQGSVRDVVNASSQVKAHLEYDGYGVRADPQSGVSDRYGYTAREWHAGAGIQHNGARDLVPALGKWMQEDPIGFQAGDANLRRYVGNDPVNHSDPSGLESEDYYFNIGALTFGVLATGGTIVGFVGASKLGEPSSIGAAIRDWRWWPTLFWLGAVLFTASVPFITSGSGGGNWGMMYPGSPGWLTATEIQLGLDAERDRRDACFAAGTRLLTPGGSKPIEQLQEGDLVLARGEDDPYGAVQAKPVEAVFVGEGYVLELRVSGQVIRTTSEHPFWVIGKGWLAASDLAEGDLLLTHEGKPVAVEQAAQTVEHVRVYNLRVAEHRTYFVGCDEWGFAVWAHNACYKAKRNPTNPGGYGIEVTNRVGSDTWVMLNGSIRPYSYQDARNLAKVMNRLSRQRSPGAAAGFLGPDCSVWARVYMDDHGGSMQYLYDPAPPHRTGRLPGDNSARQDYNYHAVCHIAGRLFDELHPGGISNQQWETDYQTLNGYTPEQYRQLMYFGPNPPSGPTGPPEVT